MPGKLELTVLLTRIMLPFLTLVALAAAFMGMLNSLHRFFVPALSPAMFNVATIVVRAAARAADAARRAAADHGDRDRHAGRRRRAARAAVAAASPRGVRVSPVLDWREDGLRQVLLLMGPGTHRARRDAGQRVRQHGARHAERARARSSWLNYAFRLMYLPIGLFGVSIAHRDAARRLASRGAATTTRRCAARSPTACR